MTTILNNVYDVIIIGSGNAALCAGISALETNNNVLIIEKADEKEWGGNSRYTAGAMRFAYDSNKDLINLLKNPADERIANTDFGSYTKEKFKLDLLHFNEGEPLAELQEFLVENSLDTIQWLASHNIKFDPIYSRQSFVKDGKYIFWGGLTLEAEGEGDGLVGDERTEFLKLGGKIIYNCEALEIIQNNNQIAGVKCLIANTESVIKCKTVVLGCGGFESNKELREKYLGPDWGNAKVRGTRHNMGKGIEMAEKLGADLSGNFSGCHAVPMDRFMPDYGNLNLPHIERKHYRKISYLFGIMVNQEGKRFVDEGLDFRNYTYAQFGRAVLEQPNSIAWQFFDAKNFDILYSEYKTEDASFYEADTIEALVAQIKDIDQQSAIDTIAMYNGAVDKTTSFDPTVKDGKSTKGLELNKTNWATTIDQPPFRAYPVTAGITFTYGGLKVNKKAEVIDTDGQIIPGLFACGEMVGGLFFYGYPGGSGLTSGSLFGRCAGKSAANFVK